MSRFTFEPGVLVALALAACAIEDSVEPFDEPVSLVRYKQIEIEPAANDTGTALPSGASRDLTEALERGLTARGITVAAGRSRGRDVAVLRSGFIAYPQRPAEDGENMGAPAIVKATLIDKRRRRAVTDLVVAAADVTSVGSALADALADLLAEPAPAGRIEVDAFDRYRIGQSVLVHRGKGVFSTAGVSQAIGGGRSLDLRRIEHRHDVNRDPDVPPFTNVTLNDRVPRLIDKKGREYARLTLYNIDPPLEDLPSREPGVDRGTDFRDPANLVKGAYSNYVSPLFTLDPKPRPVPGHPIGHFLVKLEIPGYPTVLTGMTTIMRADDELVDLTLGRQLGIGGVLLTPQPGRLNTAVEALEELSRRQSRLKVTDGRYYRNVRGRNVGPEYIIEDGNVTFARFKLPIDNARDALAMFLEHVDRGAHNTFGSLVNRPHKGTGAGCAGFAVAWLKAAGIIPFVDESAFAAKPADRPPGFWAGLYRRVNIPWSHIGCDERLGLDGLQSADYTVYDLLFFGESDADIIEASQGLANKVREDVGVLGATLFQFGAFTPLRDLVIDSRRKDPNDRGDYAWAAPGRGLAIGFWENGLFSDWVKGRWRRRDQPKSLKLVREGRFRGIEIDAMATPRQAEPFFARADRIAEIKRRLAADGIVPLTCKAAFALGVQ